MRTAPGQFYPGGNIPIFPTIEEAIEDYRIRYEEYYGESPDTSPDVTYYVDIVEGEEGRFYYVGDGSSTDWAGIAEVDDWWDESWTKDYTIWGEPGDYHIVANH